ncbi:MAG: hypothetical protein II304_04265 [Bacteroidales bacterium]|nr:hypothetical protein [Bacteroidales bacterium]
MKITRAAVKFTNLNEPEKSKWRHQIKIGWRHSEILYDMRDDGIIYDRSDYEFGFITDEKPMHFVDRQEAAKIAYEAGQISELKDNLYSEDLW